MENNGNKRGINKEWRCLPCQWQSCVSLVFVGNPFPSNGWEVCEKADHDVSQKQSLHEMALSHAANKASHLSNTEYSYLEKMALSRML